MPPLPIEAERLARDWLKLTPEAQDQVAELVKLLVKQSHADVKAVPDERVEAAYGRPKKS